MIELRAQGLAPERRALEIAGGERMTLSFTLRPAEATAPGPRVANAQDSSAPVQKDAPSTRRWYKSPWLWSAVAVVLREVAHEAGTGLTDISDAGGWRAYRASAVR